MNLFLFVTLPIMIPGDFIMTCKYLLGLKRRAESLAKQAEEKQWYYGNRIATVQELSQRPTQLQVKQFI